jgi:nucleoside-diphosphate-sugar epimerase
MKKKVLVLGGAGFIGLGIARFIGENRDYDITIADIFSSGQKDSDFNQIVADYSIKVIEGDFADPEMFFKLDSSYDYVYMLASVVGVNRCIEEPHEVIRINTSLILNSLKWIIENNIGKVLFSSSSECYAAATDTFNYPVPTREEVPLTISEIAHPRFTYAVTKMLGESAFLTYGKQYKIPVTIVRYQNIFGPRMGFKHVLPHLVERFYKNNENPFKIYGSEQTRAFCYIADASEGTVLAMENENSDQEIYHIGSPEEITIEKLTKTVGNMMGYKGEYETAPTYPGSVSRRCPDISKSIKHLSYIPKVFWVDGLKETISWYKDFFESGKPIQSGGFEPPNNLSYKQK